MALISSKTNKNCFKMLQMFFENIVVYLADNFCSKGSSAAYPYYIRSEPFRVIYTNNLLAEDRFLMFYSIINFLLYLTTSLEKKSVFTFAMY